VVIPVVYSLVTRSSPVPVPDAPVPSPEPAP
jgi:hypothetical protein